VRISVSIRDKDEVAIKALKAIEKKAQTNGMSLSLYIRNLIVKDYNGIYNSRHT